MANQWYLPMAQRMVEGNADFNTMDVRAMLCASNTTADTERNVSTLSGFTTLDEFAGSGYSRLDIGASTVTLDSGNSRIEIDYVDGNFGTTVGAGVRQWVGILFYEHVDGTNANDRPIAWVDLTANNGNGGQVNLVINAEGALQVAI